jgi:SAM-dependent MidA family methyltransferase
MTPNEKKLESLDVSPEARLLNEQLCNEIRKVIQANQGAISFSRFMNMALYQPKLGYYQNQFYKFGQKGDFITAPEMGKLFAHCLANSAADFFANSSNGRKNILEIGAGSGILAVNLLLRLVALNRLPEQYYILEPSAQLASQQRALLAERLPDLIDKIKWLTALPQSYCGLIIANEVLDAIPCERLVKTNNRWLRLKVAESDGGFHDSFGDESEHSLLPPYILENDSSSQYSEGHQLECRPLVDGWIKALASSLTDGHILLIDYGYPEAELYHPQRNQGSLNCFVQQLVHDDPYQLIGLQDITAHVDFSQVARVADINNLHVSGFTTQAGFLLENGITDFEQSPISIGKEHYQLSQEIQQLLMPGQMGEVVKVISLSKQSDSVMKGFSFQDHLHRL